MRKVVLSEQILEALAQEVYVGFNERGLAEFRIELKYHEGKPVIREISRVSKPGRRVYSGVERLPKVLNGLGINIVSTSKGMMTDKQARQNKVGGELMALVW